MRILVALLLALAAPAAAQDATSRFLAADGCNICAPNADGKTISCTALACVPAYDRISSSQEVGPLPGRVICMGNPPVCRWYEPGESPSPSLTVELADRMAIHAAAIGFAFSADMGTTAWAFRRCPTCFEAGLGPDVESRVALHLAYGTAALGACWLLERSGHRGWARAVGIGSVGIFGGAAISNTVHAIRGK